MADLNALDLDGNGVLDAREISAALRQRGADPEEADYEAAEFLAGRNGGLRLDGGGGAEGA